MADIKRPDIQVLEDRIKRIKSQIAEYSGLRVYDSTRKRLIKIKSELEECVVIMDNVLSSMQEKDEIKDLYPGLKPIEEIASRRDFEDDLCDVISISVPSSVGLALERYKPKDIMANYFNRISKLAEEPTGILQVNQFCILLESWFYTRYDSKNSKFYYNAQRVHEWVDLIILAAGESFHTKCFSAFKSNFDSWLDTLNTDEDKNWIIPAEVMQFNKESTRRCTKEAILLERIVKSTLYDDSFYPSLKNSIEQIVIKSGRFSSEELDTQKIVDDCNEFLVVTNSFDASKY